MNGSKGTSPDPLLRGCAEERKTEREMVCVRERERERERESV